MKQRLEKSSLHPESRPWYDVIVIPAVIKLMGFVIDQKLSSGAHVLEVQEAV